MLALPRLAVPVVASVVIASGLALAVSATPAAAARAVKPGVAGSTIVVEHGVELNEGSGDMVMAKNGTTYAGWISSPTNDTTLRAVHLCVLPLRATACKGGVQSIDAIGDSSAADLKVLVVHGTVTLVWFHDTGNSETSTHGSEISEATVSSGGTLSAGADVATAPSFGSMPDAEVGPDGAVWTISYASGSTSQIEVRDGFSNAPVIVHTPYPVGFAHIAFSHSTPIIAITKGGAITQPTAFSYRSGSSWKPFTSVANTWAVGSDVDLVATKSGVRLITGIGNADYWPVVAKWTGHGFTRAVSTGDHNAGHPSTHDGVTDASGRLVDVSDEDGVIAVANLTDTLHGSVFRFNPHGTLPSFEPQIATAPRGYGWVMWAVQGAAGTGDKLSIVPIRLAGRHRTVTKHASHGSVTVTGPASCLPADSISVGVKGHGKHGWKVASHTLLLGHKKLGTSLDGASLTAGKTYTLKGSVVLSSGHSHQKVTAILKFRSCPNP